MRVTTRKCLAALGLISVVAIYAAGAYRIELARMSPHSVVCMFGHCAPANASLVVLR